MLTDRDIAVRAVAQGRGPQTPIREVMSSEVKYVFEDQSLEEVARNMADIQVHRLPVVNRDKRLVCHWAMWLRVPSPRKQAKHCAAYRSRAANILSPSPDGRRYELLVGIRSVSSSSRCIEGRTYPSAGLKRDANLSLTQQSVRIGERWNSELYGQVGYQ